MKRVVEIAGLIAPLVIGGMFAIAGVIAPFGNAGNRTVPSVLIATALLLSSASVGVHLLARRKSSAMVGLLCGLAAMVVVSFAYVETQLIGTTGYWQVVSVILLSIAACGWYFREPLAEIS
jgi:hypothetical protein